MKHLYIIAVIFLVACSGSKLSRTPEDKDLFSLLKKLEKHSDDETIRSQVKDQYNNATKSHLDKIAIYQTLSEPERWSKIVKEYEAIENLSNIIARTPAAGMVKADSYANLMQEAKQNGAEEYYRIGVNELNKGDKQSSQNAYRAFNRANGFVPGYKDVREQIKTAYQNSIVKVVINPVRDNTFFYNNMGWNYSNNYNNDYFQRSLVSDLGGSFNNSSPALFYTDWEVRRDNVRPDWEVNLTWQYLNIPQPMTSTYTRNVSRQIESGRDTSGRAQYQTVSATLYITRKYFQASGEMELQVRDLNSGRNITSNRYTEQYNWEEEYATYSGDSRAIGSSERYLLNNRSYRIPRNEDILAELSRRIYPQIKSRIQSVANWQ